MDANALPRRPANYVPLSPVSFLNRSARVYPNRTAIIHGDRRTTYAEMLDRCRRLASALHRAGVRRGDTVAILAPNTPAMLEAHFAAPMLGAPLCTLNTRLDAAAIAFILEHSEARVLLADIEFSATVQAALSQTERKPLVICIADPEARAGDPFGEADYESFLASGDPTFPSLGPEDEWDAIGLSYTSGTTGDPKGVVIHHRGAYLNACAVALSAGLTQRSVLLWTLPMFHCNGWCYTWAVTLVGGTHVCLRRVEVAAIYEMIAEYGVTILCGARVVLNMLVHSPEAVRRRPKQPVTVMTGGAAPPSSVIAGMELQGFRVMHLYGLTESYGPATICEWQPEIDEMPLEQKARFMARQGVPHALLEDATILGAEGETAPADGVTIGEVALCGNTVMKGYLHNVNATEAAFAGGWFRTGDLGVLHPDGYIEIKNRSKGHHHIRRREHFHAGVEEVLFRCPGVMEAAVVAQPDEKWGEIPHAFVTRPRMRKTL